MLPHSAIVTMPNANDANIIAKSSELLIRQQFTFQLMKLGQKVLGKKLFGLMMKQTFYGHFVAGEDQERIKPTIGRMQK